MGFIECVLRPHNLQHLEGQFPDSLVLRESSQILEVWSLSICSCTDAAATLSRSETVCRFSMP